MADATLAQIEAAAFALLAPLAKSSGGLFSYVGRWVGAVRRLPGGGLSIDREVGQRSPALLLGLDDETAAPDARMLVGDVESRGDVSLSVLVVLRDPRGSTLVTTGATNEPGLPALLDAVVGALCAAPLATGTPAVSLLLRAQRLEYRGFTDERVDDANLAVVKRLRFTATRSVPTVTATEPTAVDLGALVGSEHLRDGIDPPSANSDPIVTFQTP